MKLGGLPIEIQVRTALQHAWAEYSEKIADVVDPEVKYGRGDAAARDMLRRSSDLCGRVEDQQLQLAAYLKELSKVELSTEQKEFVESTQASLDATQEDLRSLLEEFRSSFGREQGP